MHATGLFNSMGTLAVGGRVVLTRPGGLDPRHVWETVAAQRVRTLLVAGNAVCQPLVDELLAAERGRPAARPQLADLHHQLGDGAERPAEARAARAGRVTITDALASSEGGPFAFAVTSSVADLPSRFYPAAATRVLAGRRLAGGAGQRPGRHARLRRPDPVRLLQGRGEDHGDVPRRRRGPLHDAGRPGHGRRRRRDPFPRPGQRGDQHRRGEGPPAGGRGRAARPARRDRRVGRRRPRRDLGRARGGRGRHRGTRRSPSRNCGPRCAAAWPATRCRARSCCSPPCRARPTGKLELARIRRLASDALEPLA